jgi:hypothetical protein
MEFATKSTFFAAPLVCLPELRPRAYFLTNGICVLPTSTSLT